MVLPVVKTAIRSEQDTVAARRLARHVADLAGMSPRDKTRLATAVSEISRNALKYAHGGVLMCNVMDEGRRQFAEVEKLNMELRVAQESLKEEAAFDALTGLPNRRTILRTLDMELSRSERTGRLVAVVMADRSSKTPTVRFPGHPAESNEK
ncbi:MAG: diguanylate cyclase [Deltaproteobacteria bacterium]|nr:diguanylate cyclase [Deltaproteobacteria bacterium]